MTKHYLFPIALLFAASINIYSQDPIKDYDVPKISEGTTLEISGKPHFNLQKEKNDTAESEYAYEINLGASFTKWRFTPSLDYTISATLSGTSYSYPESQIIDKNENSSRLLFGFTGAGSKYIVPKHLYFGMHSEGFLQAENHHKPSYIFTFSPYVGTGRITNAFVVNEASNVEKILLKRGYITKGLDKDTRTLLNNLLDRRNLGEYRSKYRDNAEIQFFGDAEALLLNKGIISGPLNAAATMEIYQSLTNNKYILYPIFKGYQFQAEFNYSQRISNPYRAFDKAISFSALYGHPFGLRTSAVFSAAVVFPINEQDINGFDPQFHSPILLRERQSLKKYSDYITPDIYFVGGLRNDYKASLSVNVFHNFNQFAAVRGFLNLEGKKQTDIDPEFSLYGGAELQFYILSKLSVSAYTDVYSSRTTSYSISTGGFITYYIF
ncbi:MAG: hypothetical protein IAE90_09980 [Ignavibacteria bacterium]|nr:hypothetical protein [Ignavibacteria bacterium]